MINPLNFIGYLPEEISLIPISQTTFVIINGGFEVYFGALLFIGLYTRLSALLLGLHLFAIAKTIGFNQVGVRDFGLSMASLAVALYGKDNASLDKFFLRRKLSN